MARSKNSEKWLQEHFDDEFVIRAQQEGYRSRAIYKLKELDEKLKLLRPAMKVVDLGAAPGGWSQYAADRVGSQGRVVATDILPMDAINGVMFVQGDFREESVLESILSLLGDEKADLVMSDMAPNISGMDSVDIPRAMYLVELAQDLAQQSLVKGGAFLSKVFQGEGSDQWLRELRSQYTKVVIKKPKASRPRSREVYVLATGYKA